MVKTHRHPTTFCVGEGGTKSQVSLQIIALLSSVAAGLQFGSLMAWFAVVGNEGVVMGTKEERFSLVLGLVMLFLDRVCIL